MVTKLERVTRERWEQGYTWGAYLEAIQTNHNRFRRNYDETEIAPADQEFFRSAKERFGGEISVLVIAEDWCPDVYFNLPTMVRIAEAADYPLRIFPRDQNHDLMNRYLLDGQFMSIPVFVFFDRDWQEIGHWIERSRRLDRLMREAGSEAYKKAIREDRAEFRQEVVNELRALLGG